MTEELVKTKYYPGLVEEYEKLVARFKNQKRGLGPILLLTFSSRMIILLSFTYICTQDLINFPLSTFVVNIGLQMSYITFVLDDVYKTFKRTNKTLRYE